MKTRKPTAGQAQRQAEIPPSIKITPARVGSREKASSQVKEKYPPAKCKPMPAAKTSAPHHAGFGAADIKIRLRVHNRPKTKTGTRYPWEYCGSCAQRSAM